MKTTVEIQDELLIEAKKHAAEHRTTVRALIENGLRRTSWAVWQAKRKRPAIRWVTVAGGLPQGMDVGDRAKMMDRLMK